MLPLALALGFPLGLLIERAFLPSPPQAVPRGLALKRQLVGRYLYLVTVKTVPLKSEQQSQPKSQTHNRWISEEERLWVVFHVRLEAQRNRHELTFTYPLDTGETWWHPISLTELFILTSPNGSLKVRFPNPDLSNLLSSGRGRLANWQRTFIGRDEFGHVVRLTYVNANPNEDVIVKFDPTKPSKNPNDNDCGEGWQNCLVDFPRFAGGIVVSFVSALPEFDD